MEKELSTYKLPNGWIWTTVGEIGIVVSGGTPSSKTREFWGGEIPWITPADLSRYKEKYISKGARNITHFGLDFSSARLIPKGSILFSSRAPIGYVVIAQNDLATNQGFKNLIITKSLYSEYVYYYFKTIKPIAEKMASGTTFLELSAAKFSQIPIPLPPLDAQYRIVSKIEELFSELDHAENGLRKAQKQLGIYRHALLKSAFEGKLTNDSIEKGELPKGWSLVKFSELCELQRGYDLPLSKIVNGQYPVVTSSGINGYHNNYKAKGPCLITGRSGGVGNIFYYEVKKYWPHNTVLYVKDFCNNYSKYVYYFFLLFDFKSFSSSTAVPTLDRRQLFNQKVPLAPINEQYRIVQKLEYRFTLIENLENAISNGLKKVEVLRHAILKKAFEGDLVPQDSMNLSALKLLEQIKVEKKAYLKDQKNAALLKPIKKLVMEKKKTILEILKESKTPIYTTDIWQQSIHEGDVESFYTELKEIYNQISEIKQETVSLISLRK